MLKPETVERAVSAIKRRADYEYFFDHLSSPEWIRPLHEHGFFLKPPNPEEEGGYLAFPPWPESQYLARMAAAAPKEVLRLILDMPEVTNPRVAQDLIDAATAMPAPVAKKLVPKAQAWALSLYPLFVPDKLGDLVTHLASGGEVDAALDLARTLLQVVPDPRQANDSLLPPEPVARFEVWTYEGILESCLSVLVDAGGLKTLGMLSDTLSSAVKMNTRPASRKDRAYRDSSYVWRPAIEPSSQNHDRDVKSLLVSAVRDASEALAGQKSSLVSAIVAALEARRWDVFRRLALHVLRIYPRGQAKLIAERLTDLTLVGDLGVHHEFWLLAKEQLRRLPADDRMQLLTNIGKGPSRQKVKKGLSWGNHRPSDADVEHYCEVWERDRLALLGDALPAKWVKRRQELEDRLGKPQHPEYPSYMGEMMTGPSSPKPKEALAALSVDELIKFLGEWRPSGEWMSPSPEGLGRELTKVVAADPRRFARESLRFRALGPTYVRALIYGLDEGLKAGRGFPWSRVVELAKWIVDQPRELPDNTEEYDEVDPGWGWTRGAVAHLASTGLGSETHAVPFSLRDKIWTALVGLTNDPEPTPDYEAKYGGPNMSPFTLSINTVRGEAIHAVIRYGLWVRRHFEQHKQEAELSAGFDAMPELRAVLDTHLDSDREPSAAIRSVYGRWLPWLILLDRTWVETQVQNIFPWDSSPLLALAAWDAYVSFNGAYDSSLEILEAEYERALGRLGQDQESKSDDADPDVGLAQHLMAFYWRGRGGDSDGLVARFFRSASDTLRAQALAFVGRSLANTEGAVEAPVLDRLVALWSRELAKAQLAEGKDYAEELAAFGWWFASGKFDDDWALDQLRQSLRLSRKVFSSHMIAERLAILVNEHPLDVMRVLKLMLDADDGIGILGWASEAKQILSVALEGSDTKAKEEARSVINILGARRYSEFGQLLGS